MTIEKRSNGYRISKMVDGKRYRISVDHKPTKSEAEKLIIEKMKENNHVPIEDMRFSDAIDAYCKSKDSILSPSTIRSYGTIKRALPDSFTSTKISKINNISVQNAINEYSKAHSAKSVKNAYGLIVSVLKMYMPDMRLNCSLPLIIKQEPYIPTNDEVKRLCEASRGTQYHVAVVLASYGLRRSEILAITKDDLDGNELKIDKAIVEGNEGFTMNDKTKTATSTRTITIPKEIADEIQKNGKAFNLHPSMLSKWLCKTQEELGMEHFGLHKLRHYFATVMSSYLPEADWLALGGWSKNGYVAKSVYRHAQINRDKEVKQQASDYLENIIF